jgi:hypothetical protein
MSRNLKLLNQILAYKFTQLRLFGKAEQKGPILNVLVERLRGDEVDTQQVLETVKASVDAALLQGLRKVNVYIWCRNQAEEEPEWSGGFDYEPLPLPDLRDDQANRFRQDYAGVRVIFFILAVIWGILYVVYKQPLLYMIPPLLSLILGYLFPMLKRRVNLTVDILFRRIGLGTGIGLVGIGFVLLWQAGLQLSWGYIPFALIGLLLIGLGL